MKINEALMNIQNELVVPKAQYNSFGKYSYRSCEDILNAVKPLLLKYNLYLVLDDEIVEVGGRVYVKAFARLKSLEGETIEVRAYAREDEHLKGMSESQITGSTSSYSRKYALNGLFCIDDTKDSDATNKHNNDKPKITPTMKNYETPNVDNEQGDKNVTEAKCEGCGATITQAVVAYSTKKFGKPLCLVCQKKI